MPARRAGLPGTTGYALEAGRGKKNVFSHHASKPLHFGFLQTLFRPRRTLAAAPGFASVLAFRRNWSRQLMKTYSKGATNCEWPGIARRCK